jgi:hypothetical protein
MIPDICKISSKKKKNHERKESLCLIAINVEKMNVSSLAGLRLCVGRDYQLGAIATLWD